MVAEASAETSGCWWWWVSEGGPKRSAGEELAGF